MSRAAFALALVLALCGALLLACAPGSARADLALSGRSGSLTVTMECDGVPVGGGSLTLHEVAAASWNGGAWTFELLEEYAGSGVSLRDARSHVADSADELVAFVDEAGLEGAECAVSATGEALFEGLGPGLYLVSQQEEDAAEGYRAVNPFLVSIPLQDDDGTWVFDVTAEPKLEAASVEDDEPAKGETDEPATAEPDDRPAGEPEDDRPAIGDEAPAEESPGDPDAAPGADDVGDVVEDVALPGQIASAILAQTGDAALGADRAAALALVGLALVALSLVAGRLGR